MFLEVLVHMGGDCCYQGKEPLEEYKEHWVDYNQEKVFLEALEHRVDDDEKVKVLLEE